MSKTTTIYHCSGDGREKTIDVNEAARLVGCGQTGPHGGEWSFTKPPPLNWEFEVPRYKATQDVPPATLARFRFETPHAENYTGCWQYGTQLVKAGEEIETKEWPHESFQPLNYSAERVIEFFNRGFRSRMPLSPWHEGCIRLDNGMSNASGIAVVRPQPAPFNTRPAA